MSGIFYMSICNDCVNGHSAEGFDDGKCHTVECAFFMYIRPLGAMDPSARLDPRAVELVRAIEALVEPRFEALESSIESINEERYG